MSEATLASGPRASRISRDLKSAVNKTWRAVVLPIVIVGVWSAVTEFGFVPKYLLPSPRNVLTATADFMFGSGGGPYSGTFLVNFWASLQRVLAGFLLGSGLGVPLGIVLGHYRGAATFVEPTLQLTRSIPGICWLPLALIWFGIGTPAAVFLIALGSFYAVFLARSKPSNMSIQFFCVRQDPSARPRPRFCAQLSCPRRFPLFSAGFGWD